MDGQWTLCTPWTGRGKGNKLGMGRGDGSGKRVAQEPRETTPMDSTLERVHEGSTANKGTNSRSCAGFYGYAVKRHISGCMSRPPVMENWAGNIRPAVQLLRLS